MSFFYDGLNYEELKFIEMMYNRGFLQKSPEEAFEFLENAGEKSHQWRGPNPTESTFRVLTPSNNWVAKKFYGGSR